MPQPINRDNVYPWLALLRAKYVGSGVARQLVKHFGSIERVMQATYDELKPFNKGSHDIAKSIREAIEGKFDQAIDKELRWCEKKGVSILLYEDETFPEPLRHIPSPPALLYVKGKLLPEDVLSLGVVGTRSATDSARRTTKQICHQLAEAGLTIISGMAFGIDAAAHMGALKSKQGRTLAVLGNGLKYTYPREHQNLADQIASRGALITELFHDVAPDKRNFPPRNRIISGLSMGVLVAEAPKSSGALITARYALDQGREVFALPGAIDALSAEGSNQLIHDSAAQLVSSADQILDDLSDPIAFYQKMLEGSIPRVERSASLPSAPAPQTPQAAPSKPNLDEAIEEAVQKPRSDISPELASLSEDERQVFERLADDPKHIDVVCRELGWPMGRVSSALGLLELKGVAEREAGMRFRKAG